MLVGPGGVGKNAILQAILKQLDGIRQLPTATTRAMRANEQQGREHMFVTEAEFRAMIDDGALLEHQEVHPGKFYGVPRVTVDEAINNGRDLIADIEVLGASIIKQAYPNNSLLIFVAPPSVDDLIDRLKGREATEDEIAERLHRLPMEMDYAPLADHIVVNDDIDEAAQGVIKLVNGIRTGQDVSFVQPDLCYKVRVIVTHGDEQLSTTEQPYLEKEFQHGRKPKDVVVETLKAFLNEVNAEAITEETLPGQSSPVSCDNQPDCYTLTYTYHYPLAQRIAAPQGYHWIHPQVIEN